MSRYNDDTHGRGCVGSVSGAKACPNCYLAISTVPMQRANWANVYKPEEALCHGTLFPELNLPFVGSGR